MNHDHTTRYRIELDILERDSAAGDRRALALLRSEFALALNASYFRRLSAHEIAVDVRSRETPQEGVARYAVELELFERTPDMTDEQAAELLRREFQHAVNASHFWRTCRDDFSVGLVGRERVETRHTLRVA